MTATPESQNQQWRPLEKRRSNMEAMQLDESFVNDSTVFDPPQQKISEKIKINK